MSVAVGVCHERQVRNFIDTYVTYTISRQVYGWNTATARIVVAAYFSIVSQRTDTCGILSGLTLT